MKKLISAVLVLFTAAFIFAKDADEVTDVSRWSFSTTTDFALYPQTDYVAGGTHFSPLTGFYSGVAGRVVGAATYTLPTPLGENWLVNGATLALTGSGEITPVTFKACAEAAWTPLPFLVFSAGGQAGTGWNLAGLQGMAALSSDGTYADLPAFKNYFLKWWAQGVFQFDTGAIWTGDWTHVQMMYTYQVYSESVTGVGNTELFMWQVSPNYVKGLCNYQSLILAYAMPLPISRVGIWGELNGHYKSTDYSNADYNGAFKSLTISPLAQFNLGSKDTLSCVCSIGSRRSFTEDHTDSKVEPALTYAGREWYFDKIALSWTHTF